jgi:hypothetical protein
MPAILIHALAVHTAAGHLTLLRTSRLMPGLAAGVPDPAPTAPPGLSGKVNTILGWGKWGVLICGVAGLLMCGGKMAIGHRNRAALAADGAAGIVWVLGGLSLVAAAAGIVTVFR